MNNKLRAAAVIAAAFLAVAFLVPAPKSVPLTERYPGPWRTDFSRDIAIALGKNQALGCVQFQYRESRLDPGEYLVYCNDRGMWRSYLVWIPSQKITGPHMIDASIPP